MPHSDNKYAYYDEEVEDLPPYHRHQHRISELPGGQSSAQELPDPSLMTPQILGQEVYHELEVQSPEEFNVRDFDMNTTSNRSATIQFEGTNKWGQSDVVYGYPQALSSLEIPNNPPNLVTNLQPYTLPAMTSEVPSLESSPVSPYTPGRDANDRVQHPYSVGFVNGMISSHDTAQPGAGAYAADGNFVQGVQGYSQFSTPALLVDASPAEMPASPSPIGGQYSRQVANLPSPYQEPSHESFMPQRSTANHAISYRGFEDPRLGTWEFNSDSRWYRRPTQGAGVGDTDGDSFLLEHYRSNELQQVSHDVENGQHRPLPDESSANAKQTPAFPPVDCKVCKTLFTGRYRNTNLRRHVATQHSVSKFPCRICGLEYKRCDARRKHEWNKHGLLDAKPKSNKLRR